jgi:hypothetical protein
MKGSAPPTTPTTGEREHELNPLRKNAKKGKIESNTESKNYCSQDRKADGRYHIEVGTCVHLHQTRVEVKTPNYKNTQNKTIFSEPAYAREPSATRIARRFFDQLCC